MEFKTRALTIIVRPDDIIEIVPNEDWDQPDTIAVVTENMEMIKKAIGGEVRALLGNVPNAYVSKEVLAYYDEIDVGSVANAMLTTSFGAKLVGNVYLKLMGKSANSKNIEGKSPVKIFTDKETAVAWLLEEIAKCK